MYMGVLSVYTSVYQVHAVPTEVRENIRFPGTRGATMSGLGIKPWNSEEVVFVLNC